VSKVWIGYLPIMLRSERCTLYNLSDHDFYEVNECPLDVGGYFIINGSEKVLLAQEKMASNTVFVFEKKDVKYLFVAEVRSVIENTSRPASTMSVSMMRAGSKDRRTFGQVIRAKVPYVKLDVPVIILFRALGFEDDRSILEHIIYDFEDMEMMELLKPSLDEAMVVQQREVCVCVCGRMCVCACVCACMCMCVI
jgi:DNA-directed RNA polymerase II subunit RPB2